MDIKQLINEISQDVQLPCCRLFWDKDKYHIKPPAYFVWRRAGEKFKVESNDEDEISNIIVKISFFTNEAAEIDTKVAEIIAAARNKGCKAYELDFEDYEKETKYYHKEIEIIIF